MRMQDRTTEKTRIQDRMEMWKWGPSGGKMRIPDHSHSEMKKKGGHMEKKITMPDRMRTTLLGHMQIGVCISLYLNLMPDYHVICIWKEL